MSDSNIKQIIIIRKDLKMRRGKEIAQGAHASIAFLTNRLKRSFRERLAILVKLLFSNWEWEWILGSFKKVCLQVDSEEELLRIEKEAKEAGLEVNLIQDSGLTEFDGVKTYTCLAIGPDYAEKIDAITKDLRLY